LSVVFRNRITRAITRANQHLKSARHLQLQTQTLRAKSPEGTTTMRKPYLHHPAPALISLRVGCAAVGLCVATAVELSAKQQFPKISRVGKKRVIGRTALAQWVAERTGIPIADVVL
jgi:hypothetical protein